MPGQLGLVNDNDSEPVSDGAIPVLYKNMGEKN